MISTSFRSHTYARVLPYVSSLPSSYCRYRVLNWPRSSFVYLDAISPYSLFLFSFGLTDSGVSTPMRRTVISSPESSDTTIVSPSFALTYETCVNAAFAVFSTGSVVVSAVSFLFSSSAPESAFSSPSFFALLIVSRTSDAICVARSFSASPVRSAASSNSFVWTTSFALSNMVCRLLPQAV